LDDLQSWLDGVIGAPAGNLDLYTLALTHGSHGKASYQRLEFLGDRVLGLVVAHWLFEHFPDESEGHLSKRLNVLVSGATCAKIARSIGVQPFLRLGKQARDDGASESENVLGDVVEALIGATMLDLGMDQARTMIRRHWDGLIDTQADAPRHPKSALQEWAAAKNRRAPDYRLVERSGPHHASRFRVVVSVGQLGEAEAEGSSKQEAETLAAARLLEKLKA
jgi:ribonuclease III